MTQRDKHDEYHQIKKIKAKQQIAIDLGSGLFTGILCSGFFNPWDRALYLSVKNNNSFLSQVNFKSPYQGFSQSMVQRSFTSSIYYVMQGEMKANIYPYLHDQLNLGNTITQFSIGMLAGSISGALTNSISAVKYHTWGKESLSFTSSVLEMWTQGGFKAFIKGTVATINRDIVFGSTYEVLRHSLSTGLSIKDPKEQAVLNFIYNGVAGGVATILSSPFNYVRIIQYATSPNHKAPATMDTLSQLWKQSKNHSEKSFGKCRFFQEQFKMGWGTARVAVGMAVGQKIFDMTQERLASLCSEPQIKC